MSAAAVAPNDESRPVRFNQNGNGSRAKVRRSEGCDNTKKTPNPGVAQIRFTGIQACFFWGAFMACRFGFLALVLFAQFAAPAAFAQADGEPTGVWLTQAGDAKVKVSKCGSGICGAIVWLKEPNDPATGKPAVDDKNPNPALARRPMIGLPLFTGMRPAGPGKWAGQIYNADDGNVYASNVSVLGPDTLRVEGCVGILCGGETWSRAGR
jgi:uncharacterized protein (DUF2147 family)